MMKQTYIYYIVSLFLAAAVLLPGCADKDELTALSRTEALFQEMLGTPYSPMHWWRTAVQMKVDIKVQEPTVVAAYAMTPEGSVLCDYKSVTKDSTFVMTLPQTGNQDFTLIAQEKTRKLSQEIKLTGIGMQTIKIDMPKQAVEEDAAENAPTAYKIPVSRAGASLYGTDIQKNIGYTEVNREGIETVMHYVEEGMDVEAKGLNTNYELVSRGPFNITMYYGFTGMQQQRILGYYRHSPGTYEDLEFVDLADTHTYDYYDGLAKLQYQLDGVTDKWYDSNFDYRDGFEPPFTDIAERLGDDVYNIQHVMDKYGPRVTKARGLTWKIDVKPGDRIGFYLKGGGRNEAQRERAIRKGLPANRLPEPFYEMNWSAKVLNTDGKTRSVLIQDNGYTIMGMEDGGSSSDFDCNDVLFGVHALLESEMPLITAPDIDILLPAADKMPWTIAFEDVYREQDFDFNDAVIRITPDYQNETCGVELMAVGSTSKMYLHYDGPDGDQNLGELHELFRQKTETKINTLSPYANTPFVELTSVKWPKSYTASEDAKRFYIEVRRGTCDDCGDHLTLPLEPVEMPQALLVAGSWHWPTEGTSIKAAYNLFPSWAENLGNIEFWNWHTLPQHGYSVAY